jgi:hypothetical protein
MKHFRIHDKRRQERDALAYLAYHAKQDGK